MPTTSDPAGVVITDFSCGVGRLTLNNPARKNAITSSMAEQIAAFCARVEGDESIGAAIIDSVGDYFCSGADTRDLAAASTEAVARVAVVCDAFVDFGSLPVPTVSVVVGGAVGAGLNLALAADVVLVTPDATLESGFVNRHIHPGGGHFTLLGRVLNRQQAMVLGALGHAITGSEAVRLGAAWKALAKPSLAEEALALVEAAAADPALARRIKRSAVLELGPNAVSWAAAVELERGVQMWSMARKGGAAWQARASELA